MKIEELIEKLQEIKDRYGNKRVCISTEDGNLEVRRIISNITGKIILEP